MTEVLVNIEQVPKVDVQQDTAASQLPIHLLVVVGQTYGKNEKREVLNRLNSSEFFYSLLFKSYLKNQEIILISVLKCIIYFKLISSLLVLN